MSKKDLNIVALIGNLTRDPEIKNLPSGMSVCNFSIANNDCYIKDGNKTDVVSFFDITVWGKQAENCAKYLSKGKKVSIEGKLKQERWQDDQGKGRSKVTITANSVYFLSSNENSGQNGTENYEQQNSTQPSEIEDPWANNNDTSNMSPKDQSNIPDNASDEDIPF